MQLASVTVKGLFGVFDHDVPLTRRDRVTIIHSPNGYGKTTVLRLIDAVFNSRNQILRSIPFAQLAIQFDDRSRLVVSKAPALKSGGERITVSYRRRGQDLKEYALPTPDQARRGYPFEFLERYVPELERVDKDVWHYLPTGETYTFEEAVERFGLADAFREPRRDTPDWLKGVRTSVHVRLIDTQRLQRPPTVSERRTRDSSPRVAIAAYAVDLSHLIQSRLAQSATLSQSLDRTFPARVVNRQGPVELTDDELRHELATLEKRRTELREAGLLDTELESEFQIPHDIDEHTKAILSVYVEDVKQKLSTFSDVAARVDLLKRIINSRFLYKEMVVSRERGFFFRTPDDKTVSPQDLSSGEQHELVLLYELLFKVESPALILIDEPEISLHVLWQRAFLKDLQEVAALGDFNVILATHSPQIIGNRSDLTVELRGPIGAHVESDEPGSGGRATP
jgi:predicted ATP-binding protein involved in virulence